MIGNQPLDLAYLVNIALTDPRVNQGEAIEMIEQFSTPKFEQTMNLIAQIHMERFLQMGVAATDPHEFDAVRIQFFAVTSTLSGMVKAGKAFIDGTHELLQDKEVAEEAPEL